MDSQLYFVSLHSVGFSFSVGWSACCSFHISRIQKKRAKCLGFFNVEACDICSRYCFFITLLIMCAGGL